MNGARTDQLARHFAGLRRHLIATLGGRLGQFTGSRKVLELGIERLRSFRDHEMRMMRRRRILLMANLWGSKWLLYVGPLHPPVYSDEGNREA